MPKIKRRDEDALTPKERAERELEDDEDTDDEEEEETEEEPVKRPVGRPMSNFKPKIATTPKEVKRRFGIVVPQPLRIVDTETNEIVGEGDFAVIQALTDILERLERIEIQIGAVSSA